jgi:hypothetical protein
VSTKGTSNNPNFVAILRCSQKITPYICAIDTLLRSSRLQEMAQAVIPTPDGSAAPCHDRYMPRRNFLLVPCLA